VMHTVSGSNDFKSYGGERRPLGDVLSKVNNKTDVYLTNCMMGKTWGK
jgi:hypothetical protein